MDIQMPKGYTPQNQVIIKNEIAKQEPGKAESTPIVSPWWKTLIIASLLNGAGCLMIGSAMIYCLLDQ